LIGVELIEEAISLLVEFKRFFGINLFVIKLKYVIFETSVNFHLSLQIDWSLLGSKSLALRCIIKVQGVSILWSLVQTFKETDSWSLSSWVLDSLGIVVLEGVSMIVLAIWSTEQWFWNSLWVGLNLIDLGLDGFSHELFLLMSHLLSWWDDRTSLLLFEISNFSFKFNVRLEQW